MRIREKINHEMELLEQEIKNCQRQLHQKSRILEMIQRLVPLHSVGAFIDPETRLVRPILTNGDPEMNLDMATHIADVDDEWFSALNEADTVTVATVGDEWFSALNETDNMAVATVKMNLK